MVMEKLKQKRWLELALFVAALAGLSIGFMYLLGYLMGHFNIPIDRFATTAYLVVFLVTLASCAGIFVPVAFMKGIIGRVPVPEVLTRIPKSLPKAQGPAKGKD
jgi:hypothetical protein